MIPTETGRAGDSQPAWPWASPCALPRFYPFKDVFICGEVRSRATSLPLIHFPTKGWNSPGVEARGLPSPPGAGQELRGLATIWGSLIYFFFFSESPTWEDEAFRYRFRNQTSAIKA